MSANYQKSNKHHCKDQSTAAVRIDLASDRGSEKIRYSGETAVSPCFAATGPIRTAGSRSSSVLRELSVVSTPVRERTGRVKAPRSDAEGYQGLTVEVVDLGALPAPPNAPPQGGCATRPGVG